MRTIRLFDPQSFKVDHEIQLHDFAAKHLAQVLRATVGDEIVLFNGQGGEYSAVITKIKKQQVSAKILKFDPRECESPLQLHLAQAISRGDKMDYTLQKATELGVTTITPLITERAGVKLDAERTEKRYQHWQRVIISACEQSGRNRIPTLNEPIKLTNWLPTVSEKNRFVLHHRSEKSFHDYPLQEKNVVLLIGSEGGLSAEEINLAQDFNFQPVLLGPRILRTETASVTALTLLQYLAGDL